MKKIREYKFRGKGIANNEWYYGDLIIANDTDKSKHYYIIANEYSDQDCNIPNTIKLDTCNSPEVDLETVGLSTGLHDKNGKEIYEGDIVKVKYLNVIYVGTVKFNEEYCEYRIELVNAYINLWKKLKDIEVIGNVTDNSKLLKEEK